MRPQSKKSIAVSIPFLAAVAVSCSSRGVNVHLNAAGQCVGDSTGQPVDPRACTGHGGYYGGAHYYYSGSSSSSGSAPASSTVRGVLGGSADAHGSAGASHAGGGAGE
jgi:hypothetical protein